MTSVWSVHSSLYLVSVGGEGGKERDYDSLISPPSLFLLPLLDESIAAAVATAAAAAMQAPPCRPLSRRRLAHTHVTAATLFLYLPPTALLIRYAVVMGICASMLWFASWTS